MMSELKYGLGTVASRSRCPKCSLEGKDTNGDNLAIYTDGHTHCFGCGYHTPVPIDVKVANLANAQLKPTDDVANDFGLPDDCVLDIPEEPMKWLKSYNLTNAEIKKHNFMWSPSRNLLIFVILDQDNNVRMWQGRNFGKYPFDKPKYLTGGDKSGIIYEVGLKDNKDKAVILTEDLISAIKIGRIYQAVPLFGATIPLEMVRKLSKSYEILGVWLDHDKKVEAVKQALRASQFMPTFVVDSVLDPKGYHLEAITELVDLAARQAAYKDEIPSNTTVYEGIPHVLKTDPEDVPDPGLNENYSTFLARAGILAKDYTYQEFLNRKNRLYEPRRRPGVAQPMPNYYNDDFPTSSDPHDPEPGEQYMDWRERLCAPDTGKAVEEYNRRLQILIDTMEEAQRYEYRTTQQHYKH